jgi:CRP-like cAMP-binding protein
MTLTLIALNFSCANHCMNLISAANTTGCLPPNVYKLRDTPHAPAQLHRAVTLPSFKEPFAFQENTRLLAGTVMPVDQRPPNRLLQTLSAADFALVHPHLEIVELDRGKLLVEAGGELTYVYLPHSGIISSVVSLSEGQAVEVAMIGRDGIVGATEALCDAISLSDAAVVCQGRASVIAVEDFRAIAAESAAWRQLLARHEQSLLAQAQQSVACNAAHSVEERLSRWLLRARDLWDGETLPMTQEQLARMIGVQRNAISIVAHALQQAGVLSYSRGQIEIIDVEALRKSACECYHAVHAKQAHLFK